MGLDARKPVFGGLRTTKVQNSRISDVRPSDQVVDCIQTTGTTPLTTKWCATSQTINRNMQNFLFLHLFFDDIKS